jgi:hypothetical protein
MPLIIPYSSPPPLAVLGGGSTFTANGVASQHLRATIAGGSGFTPNGRLLIVVATPATLAGHSTFSARGRIGSEANVFGLVDVGGGSAMSAAGHTVINGLAVLAGSSGFSATGRVAEGDQAEFNIFLTVGNVAGPGYAAAYSARIYADGVSYPIKAFTYSEGRLDAGASLECTLQRPADRAAILAATSFKFDVYDNGSWTTLFDTGKRAGGNFGFAWTDGRPADALAVSTVGPIAEALAKSPARNLTIYDSLREAINAADYESIYDENGIAYPHDLHPIADMRLNDLLSYVFVTKCGFTAVQTNLPNFPIRRADASITGTYLESVAAAIGVFEPLIFADANNVLWVLDSTVALPAGFSAAVVEIGHTQYKNAQFRITDQTADGYVVQYSDSGALFDYFGDRDVADDAVKTGTSGNADYTETYITRRYRDYYKISNPAVPVRTEKILETTRVRAYYNGVLIDLSETNETIEFDAKLRLRGISKTTDATIPDITDAGFSAISEQVRSESTEFVYLPDPTNPRREYLARTEKRIDGLLAIDSQNQHLGRPFKQEFYNAWRAGNLSGRVATTTGPIQTVTETVYLQKSGQVEVRTRTVDFMTTPPVVINETTDARAGDITTNGENSATHETIVYRTGLSARTDNKLETLAVGELPIAFARPLARRRLDRRQRKTGSVNLKGLNLAFGRGSVFKLLDRDGGSAGTFIVEGRSISGANLGDRSQQTNQILEVTEITANGPAIAIATAPPGGVVAAAGSTTAFTLDFEGRTGFSLTATCADANVRVWAKAASGDAFQNLHTTPLSTAPFTGGIHTYFFELRIGGGAANGNYTVAIRNEQA